MDLDLKIKELSNRKRALTITKNNGVFKEYNSIKDFSVRTVSKMITRMLNDPELKFGCSICGWNDTVGDIHHINGRKIKDPDNINNLCYLCPNCHRKFHNGLIKKEDLLSIEKFIGDTWKKYAFKYLEKGQTYKHELVKINKELKSLKDLKTLDELKSSDINFKKFGWVGKASKIIKIEPQKVSQWLIRVDKEFYNSCYKRKTFINNE